MSIELDDAAKRLIEKLVRSGKYANAQEVLTAALQSLEDQQDYGDFAPGELDALLEEGQRSLREHGPMPLDEFISQIRTRGNARRPSTE